MSDACWGKRLAYAMLASVIPSLVIASVIELFKHEGALAWLEAQAASSIARSNIRDVLRFSGTTSNVSVKLGPIQQLPPIIVIDDELYETYFAKSSPLDREKLAHLIRKIAALTPKSLVIDLDLSPDLESYEPGTKARKLYETLCRVARGDFAKEIEERDDSQGTCLVPSPPASTDGTCRVPLVLIKPFPASEDKDDPTKVERQNNANAAWQKLMRDNLGPCIYYAESDVVEHDDVASHFDSNACTLGRVAYDILRNQAAERHCASQSRGHDPSYSIINPAAVIAATFDLSMRPDDAARPDDAVLILLVPRFDKGRLELPKNSRARISDEVVFLGGTWGRFDKHTTLVTGDVSGVVIHAAIFHSSGQWYLRASWIFFIVDIALGIALGGLLRFVAEYGVAAQERLLRISDASACCRLAPEGAYAEYGAVWGWWLIFAAIVGAAIVSFWAGGRIYFGETLAWFSPVALIVGFGLHALKEVREESPGAHGGPPAPGSQQQSRICVGRLLWWGWRVGAVVIVVLGVKAALFHAS